VLIALQIKTKTVSHSAAGGFTTVFLPATTVLQKPGLCQEKHWQQSHNSSAQTTQAIKYLLSDVHFLGIPRLNGMRKVSWN